MLLYQSHAEKINSKFQRNHILYLIFWDYFKYIIKKREKLDDNLPAKMNACNSNRITFRLKTECYL